MLCGRGLSVCVNAVDAVSVVNGSNFHKYAQKIYFHLVVLSMTRCSNDWKAIQWNYCSILANAKLNTFFNSEFYLLRMENELHDDGHPMRDSVTTRIPCMNMLKLFTNRYLNIFASECLRAHTHRVYSVRVPLDEVVVVLHKYLTSDWKEWRHSVRCALRRDVYPLQRDRWDGKIVSSRFFLLSTFSTETTIMLVARTAWVCVCVR